LKLPERCANIEDVRLGIDTLDREIIALIGRRARYVAAAARYKTGEDSVRAPERRKAMLEARRRWAQEERLNPDVIEEVYETLVSYFVAREMDRWRNAPLNENRSR
jgi:isochorismate pyruvate lyase